MIWFNPLYSNNVKTSQPIFLNLIKKHFPPHHKFHKLFHKNTVNISYSCTANIKIIINSHNAKILFPKRSTKQKTCNCLNKDTCPLEQKCLITNVVYKAKVISSNRNYQEKVYFDSCEIWRIKDLGYHPKVKREIVNKCVPFNP